MATTDRPAPARPGLGDQEPPRLVLDATTVAIALAVGVAVVSLFAVVGASLNQSIDDAVDKQFTGDLVIIGEGAGGLSTDLAPAVAELPEVAAASPRGGGPVRIDGERTLVPTFDPATIESVENLDVRQGSLRDLRPDQVGGGARLGLRQRPPATVVQVDWDSRACPLPRAGSALRVFIHATGSSLQVFILAGQVVTEITRSG